jgi:hypothetical protein
VGKGLQQAFTFANEGEESMSPVSRVRAAIDDFLLALGYALLPAHRVLCRTRTRCILSGAGVVTAMLLGVGLLTGDWFAAVLVAIMWAGAWILGWELVRRR